MKEQNKTQCKIWKNNLFRPLALAHLNFNDFLVTQCSCSQQNYVGVTLHKLTNTNDIITPTNTCLWWLPISVGFIGMIY